MGTYLLSGLLLFLLSGAAFADERKLQAWIDSESWREGVEYCETTLLDVLSRRPDLRNVPATDLSRMATYCAALASRGSDADKTGWWWYTAVSLDLKAAEDLLPKMREKGLLLSLPAPRSRVRGSDGKLDKGTVRLISGEIVTGSRPRLLTKGRASEALFRPVAGVRQAVVAIEVIIARDGVPRQPLLVQAQAHPAQVFFAYRYLSDWRFKPARVNGEPVDCAYTLTVTIQRQ